MTDKHNSITTRLLNFFSQLPIPVARFIARVLAGLVNLLHI
ncbi:lipid A biosynthesis acyltransferase, partial [Staphylococcus warneri]